MGIYLVVTPGGHRATVIARSATDAALAVNNNAPASCRQEA